MVNALPLLFSQVTPYAARARFWLRVAALEMLAFLGIGVLRTGRNARLSSFSH